MSSKVPHWLTLLLAVCLLHHATRLYSMIGKSSHFVSCNLLSYSILIAACILCALRLVHCFGLHFNCFVLLSVAWVLTSLARDTFWVRFASVIFHFIIFLPLSCPYDCYILDTIFVKQCCPHSSFHNFFRSVSCIQYLSLDRANNVLRVNLTLTRLKTLEFSTHLPS